MVIKKNTWHYKAWSWSHQQWGGVEPKNTDLCSYMRRLISLPFMATLLVVLAAAAGSGYIIYRSVQIVGGLPLGYIPSGWGVDDVRRYDGLKVGSLELYPWHAMLPALITYALYRHFGVASAAEIIVALVSIPVCIYALYRLWKSDSLSIAREWAAAKKQGGC